MEKKQTQTWDTISCYVSLGEVHIINSIGTCTWVGHTVYRVSKTGYAYVTKIQDTQMGWCVSNKLEIDKLFGVE